MIKMSKAKPQVKSKFYYYFWGICTVSVVLGQLYVGTGYRVMAESTLQLHNFFLELSNGRYN